MPPKITDLCEVVPTWNMDHESWLEARRLTIGGSDVATICGFNKYSSALTLYSEKLGLIEHGPSNEAMDIGTELELSVARLFAKRENAAVVQWPVILRSKTHKFMAANLDFLIVKPTYPMSDDGFKLGEVTVWEHEEPPPGIIAILECKTGAIASPGAPHLWFQGPTGESIPEGYQCQGYWYMAATGLPLVRFAALLGGHGLQIRNLPHDEEMIEDFIQIGAEFYELLQTETPPEGDGSASTEETLKALYPVGNPEKVYDGGAELEEAWEAYEAAKASVETAKRDAVQSRARVVQLLGDAAVGLANGEKILTFKNNKDSDWFDEKKFEKENPEEYKKYVSKKPGNRVLRKSG